MCLNTVCNNPLDRFDWTQGVVKCRPYVQECSYHTDCPEGQICEIDLAVDRSKVVIIAVEGGGVSAEKGGRRSLFGGLGGNGLHHNRQGYGFCVPIYAGAVPSFLRVTY